MKYIIRLAFWCFLTSCNFNQTDNTQTKIKERTAFDTASSKYEILIRLSCGEGGVSSKEFDSTKTLLLSRDYKTVIKNLLSPNPVTQITSVVALETLKHRKKIHILPTEQEQINLIKNSKIACSVCEGCTHHFTGIIRDIFEPTDSNGFIKSIKYRLGLL